MFLLSADTADSLWRRAIDLLSSIEARHQKGRNGATREVMRVAFELSDPRQRWITSRIPAINPAFAIAEVVWMVGGRNDAAFLNYWNRQLPRFAGDGSFYHGAYGHRLRHHFGVDQLARAAEILGANPDGRQVVLQIWDVNSDLPLADSTPRDADIPCNVTSVLKVREGRLDWLQLSRSNDVFRGIPYNFVQFTFLQEIVAGWIGIPMGVYTHISDSLHVYERDLSELNVADESPLLVSTDTFALSKQKSNNLWKELEIRAEKLSLEQLSQEEQVTLCQLDSVPQSFQDALYLLGAESSRRRGWDKASRQLMSSCNSPLIRALWDAWSQRCMSF